MKFLFQNNTENNHEKEKKIFSKSSNFNERKIVFT